VNSNVAYALPRDRLLGDLRAASVPMDQVHVFLGGADSESEPTAWRNADGARFYNVSHNSIDFTAMVHLTEHHAMFPGVKQWFYMHDTTAVGRGFWCNVTRWCNRLPACALPLTRYLPSSSIGLYDYAFLLRRWHRVMELKNPRGSAGVEKWKRRGFGWEDAMIKACDRESEVPLRRFTRRCYNATLRRRTCMCNPVVDRAPVRVYGPGSAARVAYRFPCADLTKFKANFKRNASAPRTDVLALGP
jgi:hypothetical protein